MVDEVRVARVRAQVMSSDPAVRKVRVARVRAQVMSSDPAVRKVRVARVRAQVMSGDHAVRKARVARVRAQVMSQVKNARDAGAVDFRSQSTALDTVSGAYSHPVPDGLAEDDVVISAIIHNNSVAITSGPSGSTLMASGTAAGRGWAIYHQSIGAVIPTSLDFTHSGSAALVYAAALTNADTSDPIDNFVESGLQAADSSPTEPAVTSNADGGFAMTFAFSNDNVSWTHEGAMVMEERYGGLSSAGSDMALHVRTGRATYNSGETKPEHTNSSGNDNHEVVSVMIQKAGAGGPFDPPIPARRVYNSTPYPLYEW